jgi:hypothetical protein
MHFEASMILCEAVHYHSRALFDLRSNTRETLRDLQTWLALYFVMREKSCRLIANVFTLLLCSDLLLTRWR